MWMVCVAMWVHVFGLACGAFASPAIWFDRDTLRSLDIESDSAVFHNDTDDALTIDSIRVVRNPALVPDGLVQFWVRPYRPGLGESTWYTCTPCPPCPFTQLPIRVPPRDSSWFTFVLTAKIHVWKARTVAALYDTAAVSFVVYAAGTSDSVTILGAGWDPTSVRPATKGVLCRAGTAAEDASWDICGRRLAGSGAGGYGVRVVGTAGGMVRRSGHVR